MKLKVPKNGNYAAVVVEIKNIVTLENCDNVVAALIMGNQVIVNKETKIGDVGLYFPLETQLTDAYLSNNNLYKDAEYYFSSKFSQLKLENHPQNQDTESHDNPQNYMEYLGTSSMTLA